MTIVLRRGLPIFSSKRVIVTRGEDSGRTFSEFKAIDPEMSFLEMAALRARGVSPTTIDESLGSAGHVFANFGVSAVLTMDYAGDVYLLTVRQERPDFGDSVAKLVSGYVPSDFLLVPKLAIHCEIAEEVLPVTKDRRLVRFVHNRKPLDRPFGNHFVDANSVINLIPPACYCLPGMGLGEVSIMEDTKGKPSVYFHAPTNSAQLVFGYHLNSEGFAPEEVGLSMQHSEDHFADGILETRLHPESIYLIRLQKGDLTDYVATMVGGELKPVDPRKVVLSEAFAPKENRIVSVNNITLDNYLAERG